MAKLWLYSDAGTHTTGTMQCTACGKKIDSGQYRYREGRDGFINQHRTCSADDGQWWRIDQAAIVRADFDAKRRGAFAQFVAQWGLPDDLVEEAQQSGQGAGR